MTLSKFLRVIQFLSMWMLLNSLHGIRIAGSDLLEMRLTAALQEELRTVGIDADIDLTGSMLALEALSSGYADAAIVAVPDGSGQPGFSRQFGFAFQIVAFGVNQRNPLEELDYSQLGNIFKSSGSTETWTGLVESTRLQDRKINLWAARSDKVIALEIFNSVVLKGSPLKEYVRYDAQTEEQLMQVLRNDDAAIILIPNMSPTVDVRILAIKESGDAQSYTPTPDNVFYGDYPLRLPFQLIVGEGVSEQQLEALLKAIYSDRVTEALERAHYMPLPDLEREAALGQIR